MTYVRSAAVWRSMAQWAESKANAASASSDPWATANLRLYQNKASEFWGEHYKAVQREEHALGLCKQRQAFDPLPPEPVK